MLIATICIVFLTGYLISAGNEEIKSPPNDRAIQATAQQEYEEFIASLEEKEQSDENNIRVISKRKKKSIPIIPGFFQSQYS